MHNNKSLPLWSLQHEAAEAAGSKNEEVIEEQEKPGKGKVEVTTMEPEASSTIADVVEEKMVDIANLKLTDDPLCNSEDLRKLMLDLLNSLNKLISNPSNKILPQNMDSNLNSSKRLIQLAAEAQFGGRFDVICANGDFSYVTNTELFCQETKGDVSCYTYRQL
ncbi:ground-like domain protein [Ancylostoma caninum]|uniref:Ground-like domain protein n=1 Tax=Ancylostoma caninum TaxID=29170 RepID=A0A368GGY6_ANCCA|nr:ground-like domain protein [Ancylostoma caninum]